MRSRTGFSEMATAVPFPTIQPPGYSWLDEPPFEPPRHLQLEAPAEVTDLSSLGYSQHELEGLATEVAVTSPFRLLCDEGTEILSRYRAQAARVRAAGR